LILTDNLPPEKFVLVFKKPDIVCRGRARFTSVAPQQETSAIEARLRTIFCCGLGQFDLSGRELQFRSLAIYYHGTSGLTLSAESSIRFFEELPAGSAELPRI
ncbi:MAG: hypothetical protein WB990_00385, partial [Candidatus Acidiferrales bacterium]